MALIGKNNRQSVLDDDASLFQAQEEKSEKQKWSELDHHQRLRYFADYYLFKCLAAIALVGFMGMVIWTVTKPQKEQKLFFAIVHNSIIPEEKEKLEQMFTEMFVTDPNQQEIRIDDSFPSGYESEAKLSAYISAQEIDLIVTNEEHFQSLAKNGCFADLNEIIPEFAEEHTEFLYLTEGYTEEPAATTVNNDISDDSGNKKAYGIDITDCNTFKKNWYHEEHAILGIVQNGKDQKNAVIALEKIFTY